MEYAIMEAKHSFKIQSKPNSNMAKSLAEIAESRKALADTDYEIVASALPAAIAKGDATLAHENVRGVAASNLCAAMAWARYRPESGVAKAYVERVSALADALTDMAHRGLHDTPWSGFYVLYCSLMAGRFDRAEAVARWMGQCAVAEDAADPHDPLAMLSGYGVLDELEKFEALRRNRFDSSWHATHPFFGPLSVYLDLWHAILKRDQAAFDAAMVRREEHHVRLAKQRGEGRLEFGGGRDSKYIVDFMGIGCAIMARRRGMSCDVDTTYLPRGMVDSTFNSTP